MYFIRREPSGYQLCQVVHNLDGSTRIDYLFPLRNTTNLTEALEREEANYSDALATLDELRRTRVEEIHRGLKANQGGRA